MSYPDEIDTNKSEEKKPDPSDVNLQHPDIPDEEDGNADGEGVDEGGEQERQPGESDPTETTEDDMKKAANEGAQFQDATFTTDGGPEHQHEEGDADSLIRYPTFEPGQENSTVDTPAFMKSRDDFQQLKSAVNVYADAGMLQRVSISLFQLSMLWIPVSVVLFNQWSSLNPYRELSSPT